MKILIELVNMERSWLILCASVPVWELDSFAMGDLTIELGHANESHGTYTSLKNRLEEAIREEVPCIKANKFAGRHRVSCVR